MKVNLTVDYNYVRDLEKKVKELRIENDTLRTNIQDAYDKTFKRDQENRDLKLFLGYLMSVGVIRFGNGFSISDVFGPISFGSKNDPYWFSERIVVRNRHGSLILDDRFSE